MNLRLPREAQRTPSEIGRKRMLLHQFDVAESCSARGLELIREPLFGGVGGRHLPSVEPDEAALDLLLGGREPCDARADDTHVDLTDLERRKSRYRRGQIPNGRTNAFIAAHGCAGRECTPGLNDAKSSASSTPEGRRISLPA